jgi:hypothetical protein
MDAPTGKCEVFMTIRGLIHRRNHGYHTGPISLTRIFWGTLAALVLASPSQVEAQRRVEITPFGGYRLGGSFKNGNYSTVDDLLIDDLEISDGANFGVAVDVTLFDPYESFLQLEFLYDRQESNLALENRQTGTKEDLIDTSVNYFHVGAVARKPGATQPFIAFTLGITRFITQQEFDNETRSSFGLALGMKRFFGEQVGLRAQSRLMSTYLGSSEAVFCDAAGFCFEEFSSSIVNQIDFSGGVIVAF